TMVYAMSACAGLPATGTGAAAFLLRTMLASSSTMVYRQVVWMAPPQVTLEASWNGGSVAGGGTIANSIVSFDSAAASSTIVTGSGNRLLAPAPSYTPAGTLTDIVALLPGVV